MTTNRAKRIQRIKDIRNLITEHTDATFGLGAAKLIDDYYRAKYLQIVADDRGELQGEGGN
jgi:hypothetical protein